MQLEGPGLISAVNGILCASSVANFDAAAKAELQTLHRAASAGEVVPHALFSSVLDVLVSRLVRVSSVWVHFVGGGRGRGGLLACECMQ